MRISLLQTHLHWEQPLANREHFQQKLTDLRGTTDVVILPEMFSSGFSMQPHKVAEAHLGPTLQWMLEQAKTGNFALCGSLVIQTAAGYHNRLYWVTPEGDVHFYDKRHLFTLAGEEKVYVPGKARLIIEWRDWRIMPLICYDLRFPVFSRYQGDYDLLLYVANWPQPRIGAWDALLRARAIENQCYVAAVNRIGSDGNKHPYVGHSQLLGPLGDYLIAPYETDQTQTAVVDKAELAQVRTRFRFLDDRDAFDLRD